MKQITSSLYIVQQNESVTIDCTLLNGLTQTDVQAIRNGVKISNSGGATPSFQFTVQSGPNTNEFVSILCNFAGRGPTAECDIQVRGASNPGPVILEPDSLHQKDLTFHVV